MWYGLITALLALTFGTGLSNYVSAAIYRINGTWSATYVDGTGEAVTAVLGPASPLPGWMPRPAGTVIITASHSLSGPKQRQFAKLDIATRMSSADIESFYVERLRNEGFVVAGEDDEKDTRLLRLLGVDRQVRFTHPEKRWKLNLTIHTASGLILPSRVVGIAWWDWPFEPPVVPPVQ